MYWLIYMVVFGIYTMMQRSSTAVAFTRLLRSKSRVSSTFAMYSTRQESNIITTSAKISPIEQHNIFGRSIFIKRDDLLCLENCPDLNGNKVRKLKNLATTEPFPRVVLSQGGSQSNAMRALAILVQSKQQLHNQDSKVRFLYCSKAIPDSLRSTARGNYAAALDCGMEVSCISIGSYLYSNCS